MAAVKKNSSAAASPHGAARKTSGGGGVWLLRMAVLLLILAALGGGIFAAFKGAGLLFFRHNRQFVLRHIDVASSGYWNHRANTLGMRLGLRIGQSNLYDFTLADVRRRIMTLPSVEHCEVARALPDTLRIRIVERIPRACLGSPGSPYLLDTKAVVLERGRCMNFRSRLPSVFGVPASEKPTPGRVLAAAKPAIDLIMLTIRNFPDLAVTAVSLHDPEKLVFTVNYRNVKMQCKVKMPRSNLSFHLTALQSAILHTLRGNDPRRNFDLSYTGSVVVR